MQDGDMDDEIRNLAVDVGIQAIAGAAAGLKPLNFVEAAVSLEDSITAQSRNESVPSYSDTYVLFLKQVSGMDNNSTGPAPIP